MEIAIFGGSFSPPHVGHALVAAWLRWSGTADAVWLIPVYDHPFRQQAGALQKDVQAPYAARLRWCRALAETVGPWVDVSDIESTLEGPSYTIHTLEALAARHPEHRFRLVMGTDLLAGTGKWHRWDDIAARFPPIVVGRGGYDDAPLAPTFPVVSSTEVRRRLRDDEPVAHLLPERVLEAMTRDGWGPGTARW
jgi:nicotinate-nucleotide adenylyltransferase